MYLNKKAVLGHIRREIGITERQRDAVMTRHMKEFHGGAIRALQNLEHAVQSGAFDVDKKSLSDGYHTFEELYYHRMVLFAIICRIYKYRAWKSWKHHDGTMFDNSFIVGIETPQGHYTYHYNSLYWDVFDVKELERAPEWDGHQPEDVTRLISLPFDAHIAITPPDPMSVYCDLKPGDLVRHKDKPYLGTGKVQGIGKSGFKAKVKWGDDWDRKRLDWHPYPGYYRVDKLIKVVSEGGEGDA